MSDVPFAFPPASRICPVDTAQYCTLLLQADSALYVDVRRRLSVSYNEHKADVEGFALYRLDDLRNGTAFPSAIRAMFAIGATTMGTLESIVRYVAITHATAAQHLLLTTFDPVDYTKITLHRTITKWTDGFGEYTSIASLLATKAPDVPFLCVLDATIMLVLPFDAANPTAPCRFLKEVPVSPVGALLYTDQDGTDRRLIHPSVTVARNTLSWWPHIRESYGFADAQSRFDVTCYRDVPDGPLNRNGQDRSLILLAMSAYGFYGRFRPNSATDAEVTTTTTTHDSGVYLNQTMFPYWVDASGAGIGRAFVRGYAGASTSTQTPPQLDYIRWGYNRPIAASRVVVCGLAVSLLSSAAFQLWTYPTSAFVSGVLLYDSARAHGALTEPSVVGALSQPTMYPYFEWKNTTPSADGCHWRSNFGIYLA